METVNRWWDWLAATTPVPSQWWLLAALGIGVLIAANPKGWEHTRLLATYVHEAGHAVMALMLGRSVSSIRLEADTSGATVHKGQPSWLPRILIAFAGYPAPALAAWGYVACVTTGHPRWGIAISAVIVAVLSIAQRSWRGWVVTLILGAAIWGIGQIDGLWASLAMTVTAGYLLTASPRTIVELILVRANPQDREEGEHSDSETLSGLTLLPPTLWELLFFVLCGVCVWQSLTLVF